MRRRASSTRCDDEELARSLRGATNLAASEVYLDRVEEAGAHVERALAVAGATGQGQFLPLLFWVGMIRSARGRLADAAELLDTAVEIARLSGHVAGSGVVPAGALADRDVRGRRPDGARRRARERGGAAQASTRACPPCGPARR